MEEKIAITDCALYRYYAKTLYLSHVLEIFSSRTVNSEICDKAVFYFQDVCSQCKQKGGEER